MENEKSVTDGLIKRNLVLSSGIVTALAAVVCTKGLTAIAMTIALVFISVISSVLTTVFFQNKSYYIQMTVCSLLSAVCYIPVFMLIKNVSSSFISDVGIYLPLLVIQSVLIYRTQRTNFENQSLFSAVARLLVFFIGMFVVVLVITLFREILAYGTLFGLAITDVNLIPQASESWFGLILIGLLSALSRMIVVKNSKDGVK